ncbi:fatty acid hydroxylase [Burkholderiales bacterium GJ-E10]|nr:fatty acid hydroxylase [Burkholderiales bacterium GJ-E10]
MQWVLPMSESYLLDASRWLLHHEPAVRLSVFFTIFVLMAAWEVAVPRRARRLPRKRRWTGNLGIVFLNTALLRWLLPMGAVTFAMTAQAHGWGLLNHSGWPFALAVAGSVIALDFAIYLQHVMFHAVPPLWRLHRVHHADLDCDVTTGARFHPIEIGLSMGIKLAVIAVLGTPAVAVLLFEVLLNATAMFNHGNVRVPQPVDAALRLLLVTPDMHRVHHSIEEDETNSNFGFNLSVWDRLFGTYKAQPDAGHEGMTIGIRDHRDPKEIADLTAILALPFLAANGGYAIHRRQWRASS